MLKNTTELTVDSSSQRYWRGKEVRLLRVVPEAQHDSVGLEGAEAAHPHDLQRSVPHATALRHSHERFHL